MTTITIEVDTEQDKSAVIYQATQLGLSYHVDEDNDDEDWGDLPEAAIEGIKAGLADLEAGRVHSHEYVMAKIAERLKSFSEEKKND